MVTVFAIWGAISAAAAVVAIVGEITGHTSFSFKINT